MLKNNYKVMFFILLMQVYFTAFIVLLWCSSAGFTGIMWGDFIIYSTLNIVGAWLLTYRKNLWLNTAGLMCFFYYGWWFISYILKQPRYGPWQINLIAGIFIIALGLVGFIYDLIKCKKSTEEYV